MNVREALDNIYKEFEKTYEEAVNEGYETGLEEGYKNGANDAWALVKDLTLSIKYDYLTRDEIFGYTDVENILNLTGAQALADLKEFEAKQKVFKVGDRVRTLVVKDNMGTERFPVGTIGEVTDFDRNAIEVSVDEKNGITTKKILNLPMMCSSWAMKYIF